MAEAIVLALVCLLVCGWWVWIETLYDVSIAKRSITLLHQRVLALENASHAETPPDAAPTPGLPPQQTSTQRHAHRFRY